MSNLIKSNITGQDIKPILDYDKITNEHKEVAEAILELIEKNNSLNIPIEITIAQIKSNFKLEKIKEIQIKDSLFFSVLGDEKLGVTIQGYREEYNENGEKIKIPHISFSADIDYFDKILKKLIEKIKNSIKT